MPAQDGPDVYGPPAPRNAGFVRLLHNHDGGAGIRGFQVGSREFGALAFGEVTPYRPVRAGIYLLRRSSAGDGATGGETAATELVVQPDGYSTVVLGAESIQVIRDTRHEDPARAQLVFYNLGDVQADLRITGGEAVFEAVPPGQSASRPVNAVTVSLEALPTGFDGDAPGAIASVQVELRRGESFGVVLLQGGELRVHRARVRLDD